MLRRKELANTLFLALTLLSALVTVFFGVYEYRREHQFRCDILHARLQLNNHRFVDDTDRKPDSTIRVTIIDTLGKVIFDSKTPPTTALPNHLHRREVQEAISKGSGYDIKRASTSLHDTYFYSATYFPERGIIVRSAVPYKAALTASLERDYTFFYYTAGILFLISLVLYLRHSLKRSEKDKLRLKRQLTENAAHELKTPATTIEGYLETLVCNPDMPAATRQEFLSRCHAQSRRMSSLLADMSMLTRLDEAPISRPTTQIDLAAVIQGIAEETHALFEQKGITLHIGEPLGPLTIQGDYSLLYSLVRNVIDNALLHAVGATLLNIAASARNNIIRLTFTDNGQGVADEHLPHIFERFYRADKGRSRRLGGTGLGLAIVKNIALQYGGNVSAEPTPGGGLTITITLMQKLT